MYDVEATSAHYSAKFKVIAYEVDENSFEYKDNGYLSYAKQLAKNIKMMIQHILLEIHILMPEISGQDMQHNSLNII